MNDFDDAPKTDPDAKAEALAVSAPPDAAFEATPEFTAPEVTPVNLAPLCAHCGQQLLVLVKDTTSPPASAVEAWKNAHCLSTHDRTIWSFCRATGILRHYQDGTTTSFDRRRQVRNG